MTRTRTHLWAHVNDHGILVQPAVDALEQRPLQRSPVLVVWVRPLTVVGFDRTLVDNADYEILVQALEPFLRSRGWRQQSQ